MVKNDSSWFLHSLQEDAVSQLPRKRLTAAVADHASAQPRADVTQVARPYAQGV